MDQIKADAVRMNNNPTGETAVMDKAIESNVLSVDQYAEQLMDDLFQGIEHSLETGEVLEEEVVAAPTTVQTFVNTTAAPLSVVPTESALPETVIDSSTEVAAEPDAAATSEQPDWSLRILWAAALLSCVGALALCISNWSSYKAVFQQITGQAAAPEVLATVPTTAAVDAPNQAFANYIQQSLEALALQQPAATNLAGLTSPVVATVPAPAVPAAPVTQTIPGGLGTAPAAVPPGTILERVYIPVYQTPQGLVPVVPGVPVPNLTANGTFLPSQAAVAPSPMVQPGTAIAVAPQPAVQAAPAAPNEVVAVQPMATTEHTLVGLLELGDSSAALFEVSGVTRRFSLGERIGSSGWTLVDAKNSEAIIRRNGEIRSVFVGQTF